MRRGLLSCLILAGVLYSLGWIIDYYAPFPLHKLTSRPTSRKVTDRHGAVLLHVVGPDGCWRDPVPLQQISPWLISATLAAEDARFRSHGGVDLWSVLRATGQMLWLRRQVSGASTITMQVVRQIEGRPRSIPAKLWQMFRARQLEAAWSKDQILEAYLNIISYGGNINGAAAAAERYFHKPVGELTCGEAALLAGIPQAPNRFRPDRYPEAARTRRQFVLRRLQELGAITLAESRAAHGEPVTRESATTQVTLASHAAWWALSRRPGGGQTTIDRERQRVVERLTADQLRLWPVETDAAVVVIDLQHGEIVALLGSASGNPAHPSPAGEVNGVLARRSPGSALKPFLYATAFAARRLAPESLVSDRPLDRAGWSPQNFQREYLGEVSVTEALRRSLNIPAILVAEQIGLTRCVGTLRACGITLPTGTEQRGGLALAVGGMEVSLLELTNAYATLGRGGICLTPRLFPNEPQTRSSALPREVCLALDQMLGSTDRIPSGWEDIPEADRPWCMWKTGTSSGRRDAWAVGHNGRYAVGVWVGNFAGAGRVEYVGKDLAEPLFAAVLAASEFRQHRTPSHPVHWAVTNPLRLTPDTLALRFAEPASGDQYRALGSTARIPVRLSRETSATWFLNGRVLERPVTEHLELSPGSYELRCVEADGTAASVRFQVSSRQLANQ